MLIISSRIVVIKRIDDVIMRWGTRFLTRVFTLNEQSICGGRTHSFAARWAAKVAVAEMLHGGKENVCNSRTGYTITWHDIEVNQLSSGQPILVLHNGAAKCASDLKLCSTALSLSHDYEYAVAFLVAQISTSTNSKNE